MAITLSTEELVSFHGIDRQVFSWLVNHLGFDLPLTMWVMALWLWLEEEGFPTVILTLGTLPDDVVKALFQEGVAILQFLRYGNPPTSHTTDAIPKTYILMLQSLTLESLYENRVYCLDGIIKTFNEVCSRIFADTKPKNSPGNASPPKTVVPTKQEEPLERRMTSLGNQGNLNLPAPLPYIPHAFYPEFHPMFYPQSNILPPNILPPMVFPQETGIISQFEIGESSEQVMYEREEDRTMFMTFSKGYPISKNELRDYFKSHYGNVIEDIYMEETTFDVQPLWARVVLCSSAMVAKVLNGQERIKFVINKKHVWTRRFVSRN